jgi:hypothetical protein
MVDPAAGGTRPAGIPRAGLAAAMVLAVLGFGVLGCTARPGPGTAKDPNELLTQLKQDREEIDRTTDTMMKRIEVFNASRKPGEQTLQFSEIFNQDLSPEQRDVLNTLVAQEKDVSYKALLEKIITDRDEIQRLQEKLMRHEQALPDKFALVKRGDNHTRLAMAYLTEEAQLTPAKAKTLLSEVDQTDELVPGNKVWFFYDAENDTFRTYVTQGEAGLTPLAVRRARQRQLIQERDALKVERDTIRTERDVIQSERDTAQAEVANLEQTKTQLESSVNQLSNDIATRENSLYYHAADVQTLKDQGVLSSVLKRVQNVKAVNYTSSLDLRRDTTITLLPRDFGLEVIRRVRLLPEIYQEGRDFAVETTEDHSQARLVILDPDLFRGKEVLLVVGG